MKRLLNSILSWMLIGLIWTYRMTLAPLFGGRCRFYPSCSQYALDALTLHGPIRGTWLTIRRLARCHPFCTGGVDPVPTKNKV